MQTLASQSGAQNGGSVSLHQARHTHLSKKQCHEFRRVPSSVGIQGLEQGEERVCLLPQFCFVPPLSRFMATRESVWAETWVFCDIVNSEEISQNLEAWRLWPGWHFFLTWVVLLGKFASFDWRFSIVDLINLGPSDKWRQRLRFLGEASCCRAVGCPDN